MDRETKQKLHKVIELMDKAQVDPDIEIEYCIPEVGTTSETCDVSGDPYILLKYDISSTIVKTRKIRLGSTALRNSAEEIVNMATFSLEEFKSEIEAGEIN